MSPDIQSLTGSVSSSQTDSFTGNSQRWVTHTWCLEIDECKSHMLLTPVWFHLSFSFSLSAARVSREAVKVPVVASCVGSSGEAAMCAPPSGHHNGCGHCYLGSFQPGKQDNTYPVISSCATLHTCHTRLQNTRSSGCLSVKSFSFPCSASSRHVLQNAQVMILTCVTQMIPMSRHQRKASSTCLWVMDLLNIHNTRTVILNVYSYQTGLMGIL